ncbi:MAG: baseplate multidomain protein megatron, partial [Paracoccaceae bacterium]
MATILLSAAGAAVGAGFGGTVLGLSGAVIGQAIGATLGRAIDQRLLGSGSQAVETGRVERFRLMGASEGTAIAQVWGRMRVAGQVIWATRFLETRTQTSSGGGGGKGSAPRPTTTTTTYSYSVSLAVALCEGEVTSVGRIWADGVELRADSLNLRAYPGSETQLPDPKIEAVEGAGMAPAFRGIAYVVIENLDLTPFGNRVPQFSFEVMRRGRGTAAAGELDLADTVRAVCLIPGTGEYSLATTPVHYSKGPGINTTANVNSSSGLTDFTTSMTQLREELPQVGSVSLIVSWFGNDLRCASCEVRPKVEQVLNDGVGMPWRVSGTSRSQATVISQLAGRSVYGGTPADAAVIEGIRAIRQAGQEVMFYPFILMDQLGGNTLPDPWSDNTGQPVLPWRGRITLNEAPGRAGSTDRTVAAAAEVSAFFGSALQSDFAVAGGQVT